MKVKTTTFLQYFTYLRATVVKNESRFRRAFLNCCFFSPLKTICNFLIPRVTKLKFIDLYKPSLLFIPEISIKGYFIRTRSKKSIERLFSLIFTTCNYILLIFAIEPIHWNVVEIIFFLCNLTKLKFQKEGKLPLAFLILMESSCEFVRNHRILEGMKKKKKKKNTIILQSLFPFFLSFSLFVLLIIIESWAEIDIKMKLIFT